MFCSKPERISWQNTILNCCNWICGFNRGGNVTTWRVCHQQGYPVWNSVNKNKLLNVSRLSICERIVFDGLLKIGMLWLDWVNSFTYYMSFWHGNMGTENSSINLESFKHYKTKVKSIKTNLYILSDSYYANIIQNVQILLLSK